MNPLQRAHGSKEMNQHQRREKILDFEKKMMEAPEEMKVEMPPKHHFFEGGYGREIKIPAGTLLAGKIHKHRSLNILAQGELTLITEEGVKRVKAPYSVVSAPGIKRIGYAHTDCVWICVHGTHETDLEKIEEEVIAKDFGDVAELSEREALLLNQVIEGGN